MAQTRTHRIENRRFEAADMRAIGQLFISLAKELDPSERVQLRFRLSSDDDVEYESGELEHFEDGAPIDVKVIRAASFALDAFNPRRTATVRLYHGDGWGNRIEVGGDDERWVHATLSRLRERIESVGPSQIWLARHPWVLFNVSAVLIGFAYHIVVGAILDVVFHFVHVSRPAPGSYPTLELFVWITDLPGVNLLYYWFIGIWATPLLTETLRSAWPSVDLNLGPEGKRTQVRKRARIGYAVTLFLVPLLIAFIYDGLRPYVWQSAGDSQPKPTHSEPVNKRNVIGGTVSDSKTSVSARDRGGPAAK